MDHSESKSGTNTVEFLKFKKLDIVTLFNRPTESLHVDFSCTDLKYLGQSGIIVDIYENRLYDVRFIDGKKFLLPEIVLVFCSEDQIKEELTKAYALWGKDMFFKLQPRGDRQCITSLIFVRVNEHNARDQCLLSKQGGLIGHVVMKEGEDVTVVFEGPHAGIITDKRIYFHDVPLEDVPKTWINLSESRLNCIVLDISSSRLRPT